MIIRILSVLRVVFIVTIAALWTVRYSSIPGVVCGIAGCVVGYWWSRQEQKGRFTSLESERSAASEMFDRLRADLRREEISRLALAAETRQAQRLIREANAELCNLRRDNERLRGELVGTREKNKRIRNGQHKN
jgi:chromosome segregation ATPase